jgi:putative sporulation protein YyaC
MTPTQALLDSKDRYCQLALGKKLIELIEKTDKQYDRISVVCIGTDSCTGDSYGPLAGYFLSRCTYYDFDLYGTIHNPVHALNLVETLAKIDLENTLVIAVDSSLGVYSKTGYFNIGSSPIKPGSGVGKKLPEVGDIHIEGIVNMKSLLPPLLVLQTTRLSHVYTMAEITARAIQHALYKCGKVKRSLAQGPIASAR